MAKQTKRESPSYAWMGLDQRYLARMQTHIRKRAEKSFERIYAGVPAASFGHFLGMAVDIGLDRIEQIEKKHGIRRAA